MNLTGTIPFDHAIVRFDPAGKRDDVIGEVAHLADDAPGMQLRASVWDRKDPLFEGPSFAEHNARAVAGDASTRHPLTDAADAAIALLAAATDPQLAEWGFRRDDLSFHVDDADRNLEEGQVWIGYDSTRNGTLGGKQYFSGTLERAPEELRSFVEHVNAVPARPR